MSVVIDGTTGITAPAINGPLDAADLTGSLPAIDGSALTSLSAGNLTGALPAISGAALTGLPAPTSAQVGSATAGLAVGAVGTYAFCVRNGNSAVFYAGYTVSGSSLVYGGVVATSSFTYSTALDGNGSSVGVGTWMAVGATQSTVGQTTRSTVFLRIA